MTIESIIDAHAGDRQEVSYGQATLALLLMRLLEPKALYKVVDWLSGTGVDIVLNHEGGVFTDDTLSRMLDAVSQQTDAIWMDVLREVVSVYPEMTEVVIQYDMASVYFEGEYADSELARSSYSRDNRIQALVLLTMIALVVYGVLEWRCASARWGAAVEASKKYT